MSEKSASYLDKLFGLEGRTAVVTGGNRGIGQVVALSLIHICIIVPLAWAINNFDIRDNYLILILLFTASHMPLATFIITGSMNSLPTSLEEAAIIDGCSIYKVFTRIVLPLVKPAIATVGIFVFMYTWNDLLVSMVFIGKAELRTISVGLLNFVGARKSDYGALMAAIFIAILPPPLSLIHI